MEYYYSDYDNSNENVPFLWCATKTSDDNGMVFWGKCDKKSCFPQENNVINVEPPSNQTNNGKN